MERQNFGFRSITYDPTVFISLKKKKKEAKLFSFYGASGDLHGAGVKYELGTE